MADLIEPERDDLAEPDDLDDKGKAAWRILTEFLKLHRLTYTGGCRVFYSPAEWRARGEEYGHKSVLIVVYDGGEHRDAFTYEDGQYTLCEAMQSALGMVGCFFEECTGWYGAVYVK